MLLPYVFTIVNEIIYINTNKSLLSITDTTEIFYDLSSLATSFQNSDGVDENYSEGYFEGIDPKDYHKMSPREMENRKW